MSNQQISQPVNTLVHKPMTSINSAEVLAAVERELRQKFNTRPQYQGIETFEDGGHHTITLYRADDNCRNEWQIVCNDIERAAMIAAPSLELMIVVA